MEEILQGSQEDSYFVPRCLETFSESIFDSSDLHSRVFENRTQRSDLDLGV